MKIRLCYSCLKLNSRTKSWGVKLPNLNKISNWIFDKDFIGRIDIKNAY